MDYIDSLNVISGKDKDKFVKVFMVIIYKSTIVIKNVNLKTKHVKSKGDEKPSKQSRRGNSLLSFYWM